MARRIALLFGLMLAVILVPAVPAFADYTPPSSVPTAVQGVQVTAPTTAAPVVAGTSTLPVTGSNMTDLYLKVAVGLLAGGAILVLGAATLNRRRRLVA
jgi:hypothetical protein